MTLTASTPTQTAPEDHATCTNRTGQCQGCGGTFEDFNGGYCDTCKALGRG